MRVKVYNKLLSLFQSCGPIKTLGMNTQGIFRPSITQLKVLKESAEDGLTRIEVSYYAREIEQEELYWTKDLTEKAAEDIRQVELALLKASRFRQSTLCFSLSHRSFLKAFEEKAKQHQLCISLPHVRAIVYAKNDK